MSAEFAESLEQVERVRVRAGRRKLLYFAGCDYYRLSQDPRILKALHEGLDDFGLSTAASRKTTGNHQLYGRLESATARYFGAEAAVSFSSAYLANIAMGQALHGSLDHAFVDERSHGSLRDALVLAGCRITNFKHRDSADLQRKLDRRAPRKRFVVVTDGIFAFDGSIAPLDEYRAAAGPDALLWVDDAHAAGVLGSSGQGSAEHASLSRRNLIQTVTFSKAFGAYGGAVLCEKFIRDLLIERSAALAGNTPLPLPLAAACLTALRVLGRTHRRALRTNIEVFWKEFAGHAPSWPTPIIGPKVKKPAELSRKLLDVGIFPSFICYGCGPAEGYFRFALSSEHTADHIRLLARTLRENGAR